MTPVFKATDAQDASAAVFKATQTYLSYIKGRAQPDWFVQWKQQRAAAKKQKKGQGVAADHENEGFEVADQEGDAAANATGEAPTAHGYTAQGDTAHGDSQISAASFAIESVNQDEGDDDLREGEFWNELFSDLPTAHGDTAQKGDGQASAAHGDSSDTGGPTAQGQTAHGGDASAGIKEQAKEIVTTELLKVGDTVFGIATKWKDHFNNMECKILAVLARQYKVVMLEGTSTGEEHKFLHSNVRAIQGEPQSSGSQQPTAKTSEPAEKKLKASPKPEEVDLDDLWSD